MDHLANRLGLEPILSVRVNSTVTGTTMVRVNGSLVVFTLTLGIPTLIYTSIIHTERSAMLVLMLENGCGTFSRIHIDADTDGGTRCEQAQLMIASDFVVIVIP